MRVIAVLGLLVLVGLAILGLIAYQMWGVPGVVALLVGLVILPFALKKLGAWALKKVFMIPFKAKGAVLKGAMATVNSVTPAEAPVRSRDDEYEEEDEERPERPREWYWIDVTITPKPTTGAFQLWEPGELLLVGPNVKSGTLEDDDDGWAEVADMQVWQDGAFGPDEGYKYPGELRLNLHAGVLAGQRRCRLRYYFEVFGDVRLPERAAG